jgi:acyl dehydratase
VTAPTRDVEPFVHGQRFEEMTVGSAFRTGWRTITEADMVMFRQLVGITEPLFMDGRHAAESGYSGTLVPGMMTFAYAEGLVLQTNVLHGTGIAFMHSDLDITAPVYVGDTICVIVEVTEARPSKSGGRGVVTTRNTVRNQRDESVLTYNPVRLIRGRDFESR